jgi:4-amino-4-deoxy-L-arabinose transferase-like glycosyltransferase
MRVPECILLLLAVSVFLFFFGLGNMPLTDPDETFYAQTAKEMLRSGELSTPVIFGKPQFEKPVLYYWLVLGSFWAFGITEFAAKLPSVIFGILGVIGVFLLGRLLFSQICGLISGLVMVASVAYLALARACVTDMVLTVFILYCFLFFLLGWAGKGKAYYLASSAMAALAVLTKGPIGVFIPFVVIVLYLSLSRQWGGFKKVPIGSSIIVFLVISLPWYILMLNLHGNALMSEFFGLHNITRFMEPEHRGIGTSPFFYIPVVLGGVFPWTFFLLFGGWYLYKRDNFVSKIKAHRLFLSLWFLTVFLFFSVSRTKLVTYIFPLFPVLAIVTGRFWELFLFKTPEDSKLNRYMNISYFLFTALTIAGLIGIYLVVRYRYVQATEATALTGAVFMLGVSLSAFFFVRHRKILAFCMIIFAVILLTIPLTKTILPVVGGLESSKTISFKVKELSDPGEPLGGESDNRRGIAFYSDRIDIKDIHPYQELIDFLSRKERVWCIIQYKHYKQVKEHRPDLVSDPLYRVGKKVVVTNRPSR